MIGDRIRTIRRKNKISQTELSKALGVTQSAVGMWETNKRKPDFATLQKIADFFGISLSELAGEKEQLSHDTRISPVRPALAQVTGNTESEKTMLSLFRTLTDVQKGELIGRAKMMAEQNAADDAVYIADENVS